MTPQEIETRLAASLADARLSRNERQALSVILATLGPEVDRVALRHRAFELAREASKDPEGRPVFDWLEDVLKAIDGAGPGPARPTRSEAHFSPGEDCPRAIIGLLNGARQKAEVCVFTITDDRLSTAVLEAHRRGVSVRIITDDAKAEDLGSDVERFESAGIPVRVDRSPFHMHHKFAILDGESLLTGSYNWTRGAARDNEENLIVTTDPRFLTPFGATFERLWAKLGPSR